MTPKHPLATRAALLAALFTAILAPSLIGQTVGSAPPKAVGSAPPNDKETLILSPFVVESGSEKGYLATQTLSGTRMKTELRDIGSQLTIFTEQMMDDLGASSIYDLMAFAPNTDPFVMATNDTSGTGNDFINFETQYVTRGGATTIVAQDFFSSSIPNDRYNSESLTFTRGPNAILFGLGNAAGAFVSSTKRAKNRNRTTISYQVDDRGGYRAAVDLNKVLVKDLAAIRYAGVYEELSSFRLHTENFQRRHFITLNLTPFKDKTTLRVNYEKGLINTPAVRPWPDYDAVTPWLAAGSPMIATPSSAAKPAGITNIGSAQLTSTQFTVGGTRVPTQSFLNQGVSARPSFATGFPVMGSNFRSLVNSEIYPTFASNFGNTSYTLNDFDILGVFLEQQITRDLHLELAYSKIETERVSVNGFIGQFTSIFVDPNRQLPNGQPNPNAGLLYSESLPSILEHELSWEYFRAMASYNLDFTRRKSGWIRHLGRHQAVAFMEDVGNNRWAENARLHNSTPLATTGANALISAGANQMVFRYYMEPNKGLIGTQAGAKMYSQLGVHYANSPLPPSDPSGITPGFFAVQAPQLNETATRTYALASQSFFWNDRIVLTYGLRNDVQRAWLAGQTEFNPLRNSHLIHVKPSGINVRKLAPGSRKQRGGDTHTRGLVFHAFPWMSLSYNSSNNFAVNDQFRSPYGDLLPNPDGEGSDYGVKFSLFDRRLFFDVTHYTNSSGNGLDTTVENGPHGSLSFNSLWQGVYEFTNDSKYLDAPYAQTNTVWRDQVTTSSKGFEFSVTANPTKQWRISLNGSKRGTNTTNPRGPIINQYFAEFMPIIKSNRQWQGIPLANNITLAQRVTQLETSMADFNAIKNSPSANFSSAWTLNLIQSYDLPAEGWTRGFSLGGSMNARGKAINGFEVEGPTNILNPDKPYYAPSYVNFGGWITYKRKLNNRIDMRLQLNIRNLLDENTIYPLITVDKRDGKHTPDVAVYTLKEPRTFQFTSTFSF